MIRMKLKLLGCWQSVEELKNIVLLSGKLEQRNNQLYEEKSGADFTRAGVF